jgi:hypothetical protein
MGRAARRKSIIYILVLATGMTFILPDLASSASRSFRGSARFRVPAVHRPHRFTRPFDRSGFHSRFGGGVGLVGTHVVDAGGVVIIQVPYSAPSVSREAAQTGTYVYPQWVDGGHGVEILRPGYWNDANPPAQR